MRIGFFVGLGIVVLLVGWQGLSAIVDRLAEAGWGLLLVALFIPPDLVLRTASWQLLFPRGRQPRFSDAALAMWIGSSVNSLLPVATIGGELVKARVLVLRSVRGADAAASVVLDKTVQATSVLLWAIVGIVILALSTPADNALTVAALLGLVLLALGIGGFMLVQYTGIFGTVARPAARISRNPKWQALLSGAGDIDAIVRDLYRRPGVIMTATCLRLAKRALMAGRFWFVAWLMGYPLGFDEAVMLNSLAFALRSAAFVVPGGLGIQEAGYVMIGALVGMPSATLLAISLATRVGELIEGLPGLVAWHVTEGGAYRSRRGKAPPHMPPG